MHQVRLLASHAEPRRWTLVAWEGEHWRFTEITRATHNYDMGSLFVREDGRLSLIAPTEPGPQLYGTGGEVALWESEDNGRTWRRMRILTQASERNHAYVRVPIGAQAGFFAFWADGNPDEFSISQLYFTDAEGSQVWKMPYEGEGEFLEPIPIE